MFLRHPRGHQTRRVSGRTPRRRGPCLTLGWRLVHPLGRGRWWGRQRHGFIFLLPLLLPVDRVQLVHVLVLSGWLGQRQVEWLVGGALLAGIGRRGHVLVLGPSGQVVGHLSSHASPSLRRSHVHLESVLVARVGRLLAGADPLLLLLLTLIPLAVSLLPAGAQVSARRWRRRWRRRRRAARDVVSGGVTAAPGGGGGRETSQAGRERHLARNDHSASRSVTKREQSGQHACTHSG